LFGHGVQTASLHINSSANPRRPFAAGPNCASDEKDTVVCRRRP
jgi:hypothetical protein